MPVAVAAKIIALSEDLGSQRRVAELLDVSPAQVTRWRKGGGIDIDNADRVDLLEYVVANLQRIYEPEVVEKWLLGLNPRLRDRRHDNPERYGCIYGAEDPISAIVEALARFRGSDQLTASMLMRSGRPLALAEIELPEDAPTIDLDDPALLAERELRPSLIATHHRELTQNIAEDLYLERGDVVGLRWWSTFEATWRNWTLFGDRAGSLLRLVEVNEMRLGDPDIQ
jgi:hypothetical protein